LIHFILGNGVETPLDLARLCIDGQHIATRNVTLASRAADVERAVVILRGGREPVANADGSLHVLVSWGEHVHDDARLAVLAKGLNGFAALRVKREEERAAGRVDDAVGVDDAAIAEDVALPSSSADQIGDVVGPQQMSVRRIERVHAAARIGHIHRPVDDDRSRLVADAVDHAMLKEPSRRQRLHVRSVDLIHGGITGARQVQVVERPVHVLAAVLDCAAVREENPKPHTPRTASVVRLRPTVNLFRFMDVPLSFNDR
jgi:hypothetical protein